MSKLTLGNDLTGTVSREINSANSRASGLGESLATGDNKFVEVVDGYLGHSLRDTEVVLSAVAKNTAYSINMLTITDEYLTTIAESLQEGLKTIGSAGALSNDKLAVLQRNLNDKKTQVNNLISAAEFDKKQLLSGGATEVNVQIGTSVTDKLTLKVDDISSGKLFRSSVTTRVNDHISRTAAGTYTYHANATELATDLKANKNLVVVGLNNAGGAGTGGAMTDANFETALNAVITSDSSIGTFLNAVAPLSLAQIRLTGGANTRTFSNMTAGDVTALMGNAGARAEMLAILGDNVTTNISVSGDEKSQMIAQDVFQNSLNTIRSMQAAVSNQQENVVESANALKATTNVTQKAANSYLAADYVLTAQGLAETLRLQVASITSLQAMNKVPEAAQRLVDALAR
jgi:flagellin-like hook-associated protein FlgL